MAPIPDYVLSTGYTDFTDHCIVWGNIRQIALAIFDHQLTGEYLYNTTMPHSPGCTRTLATCSALITLISLIIESLVAY